MKRLGYIRAAQKGDELSIQKQTLKEAGCTVIYKDIGYSTKLSRPGFENLMKAVSKDDTIVVYSLDRLATSVSQLITIVSDIQARGAHILSLTESINTSSNLQFYHCFTILKQSQENMKKEQTKPGREGAKARGRLGGRPEKLNQKDIDHVAKLYQENRPIKEICGTLGISRPTFYKYLKQSEK